MDIKFRLLIVIDVIVFSVLPKFLDITTYHMSQSDIKKNNINNFEGLLNMNNIEITDTIYHEYSYNFEINFKILNVLLIKIINNHNFNDKVINERWNDFVINPQENWFISKLEYDCRKNMEVCNKNNWDNSNILLTLIKLNNTNKVEKILYTIGNYSNKSKLSIDKWLKDEESKWKIKVIKTVNDFNKFRLENGFKTIFLIKDNIQPNLLITFKILYGNSMKFAYLNINNKKLIDLLPIYRINLNNNNSFFIFYDNRYEFSYQLWMHFLSKHLFVIVISVVLLTLLFVEDVVFIFFSLFIIIEKFVLSFNCHISISYFIYRFPLFFLLIIIIYANFINIIKLKLNYLLTNYNYVLYFSTILCFYVYLYINKYNFPIDYVYFNIFNNIYGFNYLYFYFFVSCFLIYIYFLFTNTTIYCHFTIIICLYCIRIYNFKLSLINKLKNFCIKKLNIKPKYLYDNEETLERIN